MKKLIAMLLAIITVVMLAGCNVVNKTDDVEITRGKIEGNVYKSETMNLQFTKPESWVYSTDEEIASAMNLGADLLGDKFKDALKNNTSIYDMMVVDTITRSNINVGYENLSKTLSTNITEKQYIEATKEQLSKLSTMKVEFVGDIETVKLGANDYTRAVCKTTTSGITMTQVYYARKIGGYMNFVIVTIVDGYTVAGVEAMFK